MTWSRTSRLLLTGAAAVVVIAGMRAAGDILAPLFLALSLTILFHPMRASLERRMPSWAASVVVIVCAYVLILLLTLSLVVAVGQLAVLIPSYAPELDGYVDDVGAWLQDAGVGEDQVAAVTGAVDVGRLVGVATDLLSGVLGLLSNIFFLAALLLFLAFDSANVGELAAGARAERPHLVDAMHSFAHGTRSYLGVSAVFGLIVAVIDTGLLYAFGIPAAFVWGVLGALLAVPMTLLFRAVLVDADPEARWVRPLISGRPEERPA